MKQIHPLKPIYDKNSKILILGSFPSKISRTNNFYYANKSNRFWKVMECLFNTELSSNEERKIFLIKNKIALWDVIHSCEINKSSDSSIKDVVPNNINNILSTTNINNIFVVGKTALKYYNRYLKDEIKIEAIYLPSTSSANAAYSLEKLINEYKTIKYYL